MDLHTSAEYLLMFTEDRKVDGEILRCANVGNKDTNLQGVNIQRSKNVCK